MNKSRTDITQTTCPTVMSDSERCGRPLHPASASFDPLPVCLMHSNDPNRDAAAFDQEVHAILYGTSTFNRRSDTYDFTGFVFPSANFRGAKFVGNTCFVGAKFAHGADFGEAEFVHDADFRRVRFTGECNFAGVSFLHDADFTEAAFTRAAVFHGSEFARDAYFINVKFNEDAHFDSTTFARDAEFALAKFDGDADFVQAKFNRCAYFDEVIFSQDADLRGTSISDKVGFHGAVFMQGMSFSFTRFAQAVDFVGATFTENADFARIIFPQTASFAHATFRKDASFAGTKFTGDAIFLQATFKRNAEFPQTTFSKDAVFMKATFDRGVLFKGVEFTHEAIFVEATFEQLADFQNATFKENADFAFARFRQNADFRWATFAAAVEFMVSTFGPESKKTGALAARPSGSPVIADFYAAHFRKPSMVNFFKVNSRSEQGLRIRFLSCDIEEVDFTGVHWSRRGSRIMLQDEDDVRHQGRSKNFDLVAKAYRQLVNNFEKVRAYDLAEDCFIGAMEMKRLDPRNSMLGHLGRWLSITNLYRLVSNYGSSYGRALAFLAGLLLFYSLLYPALGLQITGNSVQGHAVTVGASAPAEPPTISWALAMSQPHRFRKLWSTFEAGLWASIEIASFQRSPSVRPADARGQHVVVLEVITVPGQLALFLLALRRRFRR